VRNVEKFYWFEWITWIEADRQNEAYDIILWHHLLKVYVVLLLLFIAGRWESKLWRADLGCSSINSCGHCCACQGCVSCAAGACCSRKGQHLVYLLWPIALTNIKVQLMIELVYSLISGVRSHSTLFQPGKINWAIEPLIELWCWLVQSAVSDGGSVKYRMWLFLIRQFCCCCHHSVGLRVNRIQSDPGREITSWDNV